MQALCVVTANDQGETVVESQRRGGFHLEALVVFVFDLAINMGGRTGRRQLENGGKRSAAVFHIHVNAVSEQRVMTDIRTSEIEAPLYRQPGPGLDRLSQNFSEHRLLGKILGAHDN